MTEHDVTVALVQEAVKPAAEVASALRVFTDPSQPDDPWHLPVPAGTNRGFASAITVRGDAVVKPWRPVAVAQASYGTPAISHPGQWVAVGLGAAEPVLWVVSLYGIWDKMHDSGDIYAEATLHRAISDLTLLFQARATRQTVLGGDLNVWRGYGGSGGKKWEYRYQTVFDRFAAYGLQVAGPVRTRGTTLAGCPCGGMEGCTHVRTYRHQRRRDSAPYQNDYFLTSGVQVVRCEALDDERYWERSDHCPILLELRAPF